MKSVVSNICDQSLNNAFSGLMGEGISMKLSNECQKVFDLSYFRIKDNLWSFLDQEMDSHYRRWIRRPWRKK